ncbi:MAG: carbohydrate-binding family 9-like protein [Lachnospiraceae bacterium]|nr:carbohydrate-binding family 9-like protein [Lachnospiraceae bacterium]
MKYDVLTIPTPQDLSRCPVFFVDRFNWGGNYRPVTSGRLGFLPDQGLLLEMECQETDPCRRCKRDGDPVYLDSAMEAFFCFTPEEANPCYLNFEINANGAMLACHGRDRRNRFPFSRAFTQDLSCHAQIRKHAWSIRLLLPLSLITSVHPGLVLNPGSRFTCNFYKIKESEGRTHFASFAPISAPEPDFHLPEYFAQAQILS